MALPLSDSPEATAYRAAVRVIETDPDLRRVGLRIKQYAGRLDDLEPPTEADLPLLWISVEDAGSRWQSESQHESTFNVGLRLYVGGTDVTDLMNLWHAVRVALYPPLGSARRAEVEQLVGPSVVRDQLTRNAFGTRNAGTAEGVRLLMADGSLKITVLVNT